MKSDFDWRPMAIPEAPYTLAQLYDAVAYGVDAAARSWLLNRFEVIAVPRQYLAGPLNRGDLLLRRADGDHAHACLVTDSELRNAVEILNAGGAVEVRAPGAFAYVAERGARPHEEEHRFARRVTDESGRLLKRQVMLRPRESSGEAERLDPVGLLLGLTLAGAVSRPAPPPPAAGSATADNRAPVSGEADGDAGAASYDSLPRNFLPFTSHRGFGPATHAEAHQRTGSGSPAEFASPEHYQLGLGIQEMVDRWALAGLISGGCFVGDTDAHGRTLPLDQWTLHVPDRRNPMQPYPASINPHAPGSAHWQWIVAESRPDESSSDWTPASLAHAMANGEAVPLSIGDIVMLSGDLVGKFADFAVAKDRNWRRTRVNVALGLASREPFAMAIARRLQFPRSGLDARHDIQLLARARTDYAALQNEVRSSDRTWTAVRSLIEFIWKVRGPSGCSELLVLSRLMRHEVITFATIRNVAPWLSSEDYMAVYRSVLAAGLGDMSVKTIDSDLFQSVVTDGWYGELALNNENHFTPANWQTFGIAHTEALQAIDRQATATDASQRAPIPATAIAQTAYGLHFLSDGFAAGHMRTPRHGLGKEGSLLSGVMHDFDNDLGLLVEDGFRKCVWRAFGDGHLDNVDDAPLHTKLLAREKKALDPHKFDARYEANREHAVNAMGAAMKQLHYQAQRHFGENKSGTSFQDVLTAAHGTERALLYDDLLPQSVPGEGRGRDEWLSMDIPAKLHFMQKYQPSPLPSGSKWLHSLENPPPLVEVRPGTVAIDPFRHYSIDQHLASEHILYELRLHDADGFVIDITKEVLLAVLVPDGALSWLGTKERWLGKIFGTVHDERGVRDGILRKLLLPSGLP